MDTTNTAQPDENTAFVDVDDPNEEETDSPNKTASQRRLSMPLQTHSSRISKVLFNLDNKSTNKELNESATLGLFAKFRKEKPSKAAAHMASPVTATKTAAAETETVRHEQPSFHMLYEHLNNSFVEITDTLEENILSHYEKMLDEKYRQKVAYFEALKKTSDFFVETRNSATEQAWVNANGLILILRLHWQFNALRLRNRIINSNVNSNSV